MPVLIDMLGFRAQAIDLEFAESGNFDPELFEGIAEVSEKTRDVVETLGRHQTFIGLIAPSPYAGRRQSLDGQPRRTLTRQHSLA